MPLRGPKPQGEVSSPRRLRYEWIEVVDTPFTGRVPVSLPKTRDVSTPRGLETVPILEQTKRWWRIVKKMPHVILWSEADWSYALSTALVADMAFRGQASAMSELARREKVLGTTVDARRDLRIKYISPEAEPEVSTSTNVIDMERRRRVNEAGRD